jgi:phytanoyl-CoA hydroxylase
MKTRITKAMKTGYDQNGFIVIEDFLNTRELAHWCEMTEQAVRERLEQRNGLTNQNDPDAYYARVFVQCVKLADTHAGMRELMFDERLGKVAGELSGADGIRIWHDQALFKPPYGNPTAWHLDNPYWSFSNPQALSIWVALDDATLANGCLWYLPGTHKLARDENSGIGENTGALFKLYPEWRKMKAVAAPAKAGTAVLHNGHVAHAAGANMTPGRRRAMTCAYMPDGSTFNGKKNVLPDDYVKTLQIGDVLNHQTHNPLIWQR